MGNVNLKDLCSNDYHMNNDIEAPERKNLATAINNHFKLDQIVTAEATVSKSNKYNHENWENLCKKISKF